MHSILRDKSRIHTAFEHCDLMVAMLCGVKDISQAPRSICAMGHKWMWNRDLGGLPSEEFLVSVDPLMTGIRERLNGRYATSDTIAGGLCEAWAERLGLGWPEGMTTRLGPISRASL